MSNIISVTEISEGDTYDLEVDHPDHQFYLANGILTSNSHSVLYSLTSYHTAFLKANYPIEFLLANLLSELQSSSPNAEDNKIKIKNELRNHGLKIIAPNINESLFEYTIKSETELLTGLGSIKQLGDEAIKDIIEKRPFKDFTDFMMRVDSKKVRASSIQALAATGCFDGFGISRQSIYLYCSDCRDKLRVWAKNHPGKTDFKYPFPTDEWNISERYALEMKYIGEAFVCKPPKAYSGFFSDFGKYATVRDLKRVPDKSIVKSCKGIITDVFKFPIKKEGKSLGKEMAKVKIQDVYGDILSVTIFPTQLGQIDKRVNELSKSSSFEPGHAISFGGTVNYYNDEMGLIFDQLYNIVPPPSIPSDLKKRKVKLTTDKNKKQSLFDDIMDDLIEEGMIEDKNE